jgi:site-specific recombinase XerD
MTGSQHIYITNWLKDLDNQGKSQHTLAAYRRALEHFIRWSETAYGKPFDTERVMARDVRDWKAYQQTVEKVAPATVNQRLVALSRFYAWAIQKDLSKEDPTTDVHALRLPPREPKGLDSRDVRRLLRAAHHHPRDFAMLEVLIGTGVRVGELLSLSVGDVEIGERSGKLTIRQTKHGGYREIPLTLDVRKALSAYLETHPKTDDPDAPLWIGQTGSLSHRSSVMRILNKYTLLAGLDNINPHALRHTFASRYLKANKGDLRGLARLLGHVSLNTVMIYTEPDMEDLAERMERVNSGA